MFRNATFWKLFVSSLAIAGFAALIAYRWDVLGDAAALLSALLLAAATLQSWWMHRRMRILLDTLRITVASWEDPDLIRQADRRLPSDLQEMLQPLHLAGNRLMRRVRSVERQAERQAERTELMHAVLTTVAEGVLVVDTDENVLFVNETARKLLDITTREVVDRPIWEVVRSSSIEEAVQTVLTSEEDVQRDVVMPRSKQVISLTVTALPSEPVPGAVLVLRDLTTLRKLESVRRDFVTNVSHELKTPLTSIQAYADTLLNDPDSDPEQASFFLSRIVSESERLHSIILDLIRLGRIESQEDKPEPRALAVGPIVAASIDDHGAIADAAGIRLLADPPQTAVRVMAEEDDLRTILDNLIDNALKYTDADGQVLVRWFADENWGIIEVQDDGAGIPQEKQLRVFERFYRVDKARDRERGGTGLGLSIVKHLCQRFRGSVEVESAMGEGSTFRVRLPLANTTLVQTTAFPAERTSTLSPAPH
ncbi:MAG: PAS domain-containing protein [Planctomycetaceae bacterium]|nr:PAS domain-containing protein [Planctomycetaceae bacterium]